MGRAIAHRGPDAEGVWSAPGVGLVHRRLSIIDLAGGDQPIANEDGTIQVVFNGEIYNYQALRKDLSIRKHRFQNSSDTEVIVHLYEELGAGLVEQLRGMFAFALWDGNKQRLLLARDRVGIKPLYIYRDGEKLVFGSEIKAILQCPRIDRTLAPEAIEDYLTFGAIPGCRSIFRRVEKLPPAHLVEISPHNLAASTRRYWNYPKVEPVERSLVDWQDAIEFKIDETVRAHLVADVPVGAFLSGGLDSSLIVAIASKYCTEPLQTFSIGFNEHRFSELPYARQVANQFNCRHTEAVVQADAAADLDRLVHFYDEPFADSSAIPTMRVSQLARQSVKVVLSGDGGDEGFGGYQRYVHDLREARIRELIPKWIRRQIVGRLATVWPRADRLPRPLRLKSALTNLALSPADAYANTLSICRFPWRRRLLSSDIRASLERHRPEAAITECFQSFASVDTLASMLAADINMLLPDDFLTKVDRASMAFGLEVRPPLVDHELLELTAGIPSSLKIKGGDGKWILKETYGQQLPPAVTRRSKQGFEIPIDKWLRGPLRPVFEQSVLAGNSAVADIFDRNEVDRLFKAHCQSIGRHGAALWSLLVFSRWAQCYLASDDASATPPLGGSVDSACSVASAAALGS